MTQTESLRYTLVSPNSKIFSNSTFSSGITERRPILIFRIPPWLPPVLFFIIFNMLAFQFSRRFFTRNIIYQNSCKETQPFINAIKEIHLFAHSIGHAIFPNRLTADAIFKGIIIEFINNFVQVVWVLILIGVFMRHCHCQASLLL